MRWGNDRNKAFALRPFLGNDQTGFDGLPQTYLIRENGTFRQWRFECKEGCFDLMRVQVYLRIQKRSRELLKAVRRAAFSQLVGEILCMVICQVHHCFTKPHVCDVDFSSK